MQQSAVLKRKENSCFVSRVRQAAAKAGVATALLASPCYIIIVFQLLLYKGEY